MRKIAFLLAVCLLLGCAGCSTESTGQEVLVQEANIRWVLKTSGAAVTAKNICLSDDPPAHTQHRTGKKEASASYPFVKLLKEFLINAIAAFLSWRVIGIISAGKLLRMGSTSTGFITTNMTNCASWRNAPDWTQ